MVRHHQRNMDSGGRNDRGYHRRSSSTDRASSPLLRPSPPQTKPGRSTSSHYPKHHVINIITIILSVVLATLSSISHSGFNANESSRWSLNSNGGDGLALGSGDGRCSSSVGPPPLPSHQLPPVYYQLHVYQQYTTSTVAMVVIAPAPSNHSGVNANDLGWSPSGGSGSDGQGRRWPCLRPAAGPRPAYQHIILPALLTYNGMNACDLCQALDYSGSYNARYQTESSLSPPKPWPKYLHINITCMNGSMETSQESLQESWSHDCILHKESAIQKYSKVAHTGKSEKCTNEQFPYQSKDKSTVHYKDNTKCVINLIIRI